MKKRDRGTEYFLPHNFKTEIVLLEEIVTPEIVITEEAYMDIYYITSQCGDDEIGWLGSVNKINDVYIINNIYLLEQKVTAMSTEISETALVKLGTDMLKRGLLDEVNKLRFWGHLHPGNSTSPSVQDNIQMNVISKNCNDFFIRGIFGRGGKAEFTVFDYVKGVSFHDVSWQVQKVGDINRKKEIKKLIDEKITKDIVTFVPQYFNANWSNSYLKNNFYNKFHQE